MIKHNNLVEFYEDLIENLNKSKINSPLIEVLDQMIKNPIIRYQIKFISSTVKSVLEDHHLFIDLPLIEPQV